MGGRTPSPRLDGRSIVPMFSLQRVDLLVELEDIFQVRVSRAVPILSRHF